jgi:hypothetical protein
MSATAYAQMAKLADEIADDACKNKDYVDTVNGIAKEVVKHGVTAKTGSSLLGNSAGYATQKFTEENENVIPKTVAAVGTTVALSAGSVVFAAAAVVAIPVLIIKGIFDSIFDD